MCYQCDRKQTMGLKMFKGLSVCIHYFHSIYLSFSYVKLFVEDFIEMNLCLVKNELLINVDKTDMLPNKRGLFKLFGCKLMEIIAVLEVLFV